MVVKNRLVVCERNAAPTRPIVLKTLFVRNGTQYNYLLRNAVLKKECSLLQAMMS